MHNNNEIRKRNPKFVIATVTVITAAVMLIATTAISNITTGSVLAYDRNQAKSDINECGNGFEPTNIGCQNIDSQIQGDENAVALTAQQTFPAVDEEEPPKTVTLTVCDISSFGTHTYRVTGNSPSTSEFTLDAGECIDITIGPGTYLIEIIPPLGAGTPIHTGDCTQDPNDVDNAVGEIQSGETQTCNFDFIID